MITKSSRDMVKESRKPETTPGMMSGKMTFQNAYRGEAPRSRAASYVDLFVCFNFGITLKIT